MHWREKCVRRRLPCSYSKISFKSLSRVLWNFFLVQWQERWACSTKGRQLFNFIPDVSIRLKFHLPVISGAAARFLSGHGLFRCYLATHGHKPDNLCSTCGVPEDLDHAIFDCIRFETVRLQLELSCSRLGLSWPCSKDKFLIYKELYDILDNIMCSFTF